MAKISKFIKINDKTLVEWIFDNEQYISENYKIITNLNEDKKRSFLSTTLYNNIDHNIFKLDTVLKKFTNINTSKYNFLQEQNYNSSPVQYDTVRVYFPSTFNFTFEGYIGLYLKIFTYGYYNRDIFEVSNLFFDSTLTSSSGITNLAIPFLYDEQQWGKYYEFKVPSIDYISNQRYSIDSINGITKVIENSINDNLTLGEGLSQTSPIFLDFSYLISKDIILGNTYYYGSESYRTSFPKTPEYNTLSVNISESSEGDFFEIYGMYADSRENLDNFIREMENKGRSIRIEYDIYLYEENIQTNMQTIKVINDFTKKILYRPILTLSNTTAAIKVIMRVIDLVDMSTISRTSTLGIDSNIQKYGKKLISLNVQNLNKIKIYNAKPDQIVLNDKYSSNNITTEIIKVNTPQLIQVGKIIVNSSSSSNDYKGNGLLNIVITPFDNIIQFRLAQIPNNSINSFEQYNLSEFLNNADLMLIFKSDSEIIEKTIYQEVSNDYQHGIINFKLVENDLPVLKRIYDKGYINFYLTLVSNKNTQILSSTDKVKTLLYSGTFTFYEDLNFVDNSSSTISSSETFAIEAPITSTGSIETQNSSVSTESIWPKEGKTVIIYTKYKNTSN